MVERQESWHVRKLILAVSPSQPFWRIWRRSIAGCSLAGPCLAAPVASGHQVPLMEGVGAASSSGQPGGPDVGPSRRLAARPSRVDEDFTEEQLPPCAEGPAAKRQKHAGGRAGRMRHPSLADILARSSLPAGPSAQRALFDYPAGIVKVIFACPLRAGRVRELLAHGLLETSDYSSLHCEGEAKRLMFAAIHGATGWEVPSYKASSVCDNNLVCQKVLVDISKEVYNSTMCVATDIQNYISDAANQLINLEPDPSSSKKDKIAAYEGIGDWLMENVVSVYPPQRVCECLVHGSTCPVFGRLHEQVATAAQDSEVEERPVAPLRINNAGTICKDGQR